jgi:DNA-binding response OmpR family regulator
VRSEAKTLIVEDDPSVRATIRHTLGDAGRMAEADEGQTALVMFRKSLLSREPFRLVTLDLGLPGVDGQLLLECFRGLEAVHQSRYRAKILIVSAASERDAIMAALRHGADGYVTKPFEPNDLRARVRELLGLGSGA